MSKSSFRGLRFQPRRPIIPVEDIGRSEWDKLLDSLGVEEKKVREETPLPVIQFAQREYDRRYVPSWLLEKLDLMSTHDMWDS